ncbi:MAG: putative peptidase [Prokaryotic dsDNA virus sp.]|nr:MAG: putative peptidase [Prokaryotic dsDNA virus sp.]|tara:strand:+ start:13718 stop:14578 length:861 start_codon:yes stop_codon:yes gene_type:complete
MKIVELVIDENEEQFGIQAVSLVENPAIEENWVALSNDKFISMAKIDEDKQILVGPALIPNKKIPRIDGETNEEYLVFFKEDTIYKAQELFMKTLKNNNATYEHKMEIGGVSVIESWIKESKFDKSEEYGFKELPIGTWFIKMKVDNSDVWEQVKKGNIKGFSIEGYFVDSVVNMQKEECETCDEVEVMDDIKSVLMNAELRPDMTLDGVPVYKDIEKAELFGQLFYDCVGAHAHEIDGQTFYMACKDHTMLAKKRKEKIEHYKEVLKTKNNFKTSYDIWNNYMNK